MPPKSAKLCTQKYNGARGKADLLKRINEKLLKAAPDAIDIEMVWSTYGLGQLTCGRHGVPNPKPSNCKENPWCLGRLGLEKFEKLIKKSEDARNEKMVESVRRDASTQPCGLVNWANFCYVNSFLQIWFNDPVFRQIIYDWRPSDAYVIPQPPAMNVQQVMTALQCLFFTLETTPYEDANGEEFCTALRLNQEQQDAQEFTVMFFDSIDRNLMKHPNGREMRERMAERFNGLQTSSLRCKCGHHSDNTTKFSALALSIDGHTTLSAAISGYFGDERLSDFACSGCGKRGGVKRETRIDHLPPVLLLSLNRYVYDSTTGRRKKLKTPLQYPRVLHVDGLPHSEMITEEDSRYELSAVMVHEGDNADCGHYWDIIKHPYSGVWFKYNDKSVKECKAPGVETEKADTTLTKPNIDLKYCYGLVYRRAADPALRERPRHPPEEISGKWTKLMDHKFYRMTDTEAEASEVTLVEATKRFQVVGDHMTALEVKPDRANQKRARDLVFLPTKLLTDILATEYARAVKMREQLADVANEMDQTICEQEDEAAAAQSSTSDAELNSPQKRKKRVRRRVYSLYDKRLEQVEIANSLSPASLTLCPHERISYDTVISGEVKAVNRAGAEKLIKDYGLAVNVVTVDGVARSDRLRTGLEVCLECVRDKTRDVHFTNKLEDDTALASKIAKEINTRCSVKAFFNRQPPRDSFYIAKSALGSFKRDAQRERERSNLLRASNRRTWTIGPADAARAAVDESGGGAVERRGRRKRADREAAGGEGGAAAEEEPAIKCSRANSHEGGQQNGQRQQGEEEAQEEGRGEATGEVEEVIRDLMDELAGPSAATSLSTNSLNGKKAATGTALVAPRSEEEEQEDDEDEDMKEEELPEMEEEQEGSREAAGRNAKVKVKKEEPVDDEGENEDAQMKEEEGEDATEEEEAMEGKTGKRAIKRETKDQREVKDRLKDEAKRGGKEGSSATEDSEQPSSPAANGGGQENGGGEEGDSSGRNGTSSADEEDAQSLVFNDALRCEHDGINVTEFRQMVSKEEWERLSGYFEEAFEVPTATPVCETCKNYDANATADKQASSAIIKGLNDSVGEILKAAEKRTMEGGIRESDKFTRGVCSRFVENARRILNPRTKKGELPPLCQQCVLCDHGRPRYERTQMGDGSGLFIVPLTGKEWEKLRTSWATAVLVTSDAEPEQENEFAAADIEMCPITGSIIDQCVACNSQLRTEIEASKYIYDSGVIYVKLQTDDVPSTTTAKNGVEKEEKAEKGEKSGDKADKGSKDGSKEGSEETSDIAPLEIVTSPAVPNKAASSSTSTSNGGGGSGAGAGTGGGSAGRLVGAVTVGGRSSSRRGASKGLIKVRMNSHQTIKDLKIALLKHVNYSPVDQLLYSTVGGELLDDELSLMEARVLPDNYDTPIILIVQSGADAMLCSPSNEKNRAVERGFYDTALAH